MLHFGAETDENMIKEETLLLVWFCLQTQRKFEKGLDFSDLEFSFGLGLPSNAEKFDKGNYFFQFRVLHLVWFALKHRKGLNFFNLGFYIYFIFLN